MQTLTTVLQLTSTVRHFQVFTQPQPITPGCMPPQFKEDSTFAASDNGSNTINVNSFHTGKIQTFAGS